MPWICLTLFARARSSFSALFQKTASPAQTWEHKIDDTVTYFDYISTASLIWIKLPPTNFPRVLLENGLVACVSSFQQEGIRHFTDFILFCMLGVCSHYSRTNLDLVAKWMSIWVGWCVYVCIVCFLTLLMRRLLVSGARHKNVHLIHANFGGEANFYC